MKGLTGTRWFAASVIAVFFSAGAMLAQSAKELHDKGQTSADQCAGLKLVCQAAGMDKKYKGDCGDFIVSMNVLSNRNLNTGYEKVDAKQYVSALRYANNVCDYDATLSAKKRELLDVIKKAQEIKIAEAPGDTKPAAQPAAPKDEVSAAKATEAERAFASGDFDAAKAAARQVTDKSQAGRMDVLLQKMTSYDSAMIDARQKEGTDIPGAIQGYKTALGIAPRGPGEPNVRITVLEQRLRAQLQPSTPGNTQVAGGTIPQPPGAANPRGGAGTKTQLPAVPPQKPVTSDPPPVVAARLIADARQQESQHDLQQAMRLLEEALRVQKGNPEATAELAKVQKLINSDPAEQAKVLADAIRAFYRLNYAEAEDDLTSYLSSTTAKYRGAAYFYLGASRLYLRILDGSGHKLHEIVNNSEVQRPFKDARGACYRPLDKYLSPVVLTAWNASSSSAGCGR